jgi:adenine-specific DNA-methyltransferase
MEIKQLLENTLRKEPNYLTDNGDIKKWVVISKAQNFDETLLSLLINEPRLKAEFFKEIQNHWIFDQNRFADFIEQKEYLEDSFTRYKNKIGLTIGNKFLSQRNEVSLVWPYKDCILEGGQSREEQKRNEIFFNELLAQDEITQLLEPKVLTNAKHFTPESEQAFEKFNRNEQGTITDNLLIKGNNLLALHCLKKEFTGKIKLIYIDPPYNTGKDGFNYNDYFNHSSWLTFIKNRIEVAKKLLTTDGSIWISLDDKEVHYCKVMLDEIFGRDNFISTIIWNSKYTVSNDAKYISYQHENILVYAKEKENFDIGLLDRTDEQNNSYRNPDNDKKGVWKATPIHAKSGKEENNYTIEFPNGFTWTPPKGRFPRYSKSRLMDIYHENGLYFNKNGGVDKKTYLSEVKQGVTSGSVWSFTEVGHTHANNEELASFLGKGAFDNPKGTSLIKKVLKVGNVNSNEIILDFFAGSGTTTQAVLDLNKEDGGNRQFILCEQMDYIENVTTERIKKVIEKNQESSFIYFELKKYNEIFIEQIQEANTADQLSAIWEAMKERSFLNYNIDIKAQDAKIEEFKALNIDQQKQLLVALLDKNQLYVPFSAMNDAQYGVTAEEKTLTKAFYNL